MNKQYRVVFDQCGSGRAGDIVKGSEIAAAESDLKYLLDVGAIELVAKEKPAKADAPVDPPVGDAPQSDPPSGDAPAAEAPVVEAPAAEVSA